MSEFRTVYMTRIDKALELVNRFKFHTLDVGQQDRVYQIREKALQFAGLIMQNCPEGSERERALEKLQEAMMLANAAISMEKVDAD